MIRNRINQFLASVSATRIRCTQGEILLGRKTAGEGYAEEITLGTGLELTEGKVLNVTEVGGVSSWNDLDDVPSEFPPSGHAHANAIASGAAGFMSGADKAKLDNLGPLALAHGYIYSPIPAMQYLHVAGTLSANGVDPIVVDQNIRFTLGGNYGHVAFQGADPIAVSIAWNNSFSVYELYLISSGAIYRAGATDYPPFLDATWTPVGDATGSPVVTEGGTTGALGQTAIVTHSDDTYTEWGCVSVSPMTWLPRTAGITRKRDTGLWYRQSLGADGTAEYTLLLDQ